MLVVEMYNHLSSKLTLVVRLKENFSVFKFLMCQNILPKYELAMLCTEYVASEKSAQPSSFVIISSFRINFGSVSFLQLRTVVKCKLK